MAETMIFDSSRLWKRVGLHELRSQLENSSAHPNDLNKH